MDDKVLAAVIGVVGVAVGVSLSTIKDWAIQRSHRRREVQYLAIRVVCMLDDFVRACVAVAEDNGEEDEEHEAVATTVSAAVSFDEIDVHWKALPVMTTYAILRLPAQVDAAARAIRIAAEYSDPPDHCGYFEERQDRHVELGLAALAIAGELRSMADLPPEASDAQDRLLAVKDRRAESDRRRAEAAERSWASCDPSRDVELPGSAS